MTETPSPKFKWWRKIIVTLAVLAGLGLLTVWFLTTAAFWERVGWRLVAAVQDRVNGQVSLEKISGNLVTGMVFHNVKISRPQGDIIRVKQLEVSLSLLSFFKLQPVIRTLAFRQPEVFLHQDADGVWNVANLLKKRPPPPFSHIHLSGIQIKDGRVQVDRPQQHSDFPGSGCAAQPDHSVAGPTPGDCRGSSRLPRLHLAALPSCPGEPGPDLFGSGNSVYKN